MGTFEGKKYEILKIHCVDSVVWHGKVLDYLKYAFERGVIL